jgi:hypothetical protein
MLTTPRLVAIALCAALNFAIGNIVYLVKLPVYLDSIGTILCALLIFPDRLAAIACAFIAGFIAAILTGLMLNPFLPWFTLTVLSIAIVSALLTGLATGTFRARPLPVVRFVGAVIVCGLVTGIVSAVVSAPVVVYLFGGVTILQLYAQGFGVHVPSEFLSMLPYLATIVVLVLICRDPRTILLNQPAALGKRYHPDA